jgi:hypothetical protein
MEYELITRDEVLKMRGELNRIFTTPPPLGREYWDVHRIVATLEYLQAIEAAARELNVEKIASDIVNDLFTNGAGQKAHRLVLELGNGQDGGGWAKRSVRNIIMRYIELNGVTK